MASMGKGISSNCSDSNSTVSLYSSAENFHQYFSIFYFFSFLHFDNGSKSTQLADTATQARRTWGKDRKIRDWPPSAAPRDPRAAAAAAACYQVLPPTSFNPPLFNLNGPQRWYPTPRERIWIPRFKPWREGSRINYVIRRESASKFRAEEKARRGDERVMEEEVIRIAFPGRRTWEENWISLDMKRCLGSVSLTFLFLLFFGIVTHQNLSGHKLQKKKCARSFISSR